jgi:hypothetical protein
MGIRKRKFRGTVMTTQVREVEVEIECNDDDDLSTKQTSNNALCEAASLSGGCFETDVDDVEEITEPTDEEWLDAEFGPRCDEFEEGCVVCEAYKKFDSGTPVDELIDTTINPEALEERIREVLQRNGIKP